MDDPLRPKTVPLAAETILWFEFLLDPTLLTTHLNKKNPDPSPIDLISQFIAMSPEHQIIQYDMIGNVATTSAVPIQSPGTVTTPPTNNENENFSFTSSEGLKLAKKQLALKVLTLKTAAFLKWSLDIIEKCLPIQKQMSLLRDLCTLSFGKLVQVPIPMEFDCTPTGEGSDKAARFALTLYHRWVLRLQILKDIAIKNIRPTLHMIMPQEPINFIAPDIPTDTSVEYLTNLCNLEEPFYVITYDTFTALSPNSERIAQNFDHMQQISNNELRAQILFDLVGYYLYSKKYQLAKDYVIQCQKALIEMKKEYTQYYNTKSLTQFDENYHKFEYKYCHFDENELQGYLLACGVIDTPLKLIEDFNKSKFNNYKDIIDILKLDNKLRQIPLVHRRIVELDIEGSSQQQIELKISKDTEIKVAALNVIRTVLDHNEGSIFQNVDYFDKYKTMDYFQPIIEGISDVLPDCSLSDQNKIKEFLIDCILNDNDNEKHIKQIENLNLFSNIELDDLKRQKYEKPPYFPQLTTQIDWKWSSKVLKIEIGAIERQLISCTNATSVRKLLVKLAAANPTKPLWTVNPSWQVATPLNSLLMSFQRGFLQDFAYVVLGKTREMCAKGDYQAAVAMLNVLKSETQRTEMSGLTQVTKLSKMVTWEILLIQICQCFDEWHDKTLDVQSLAQKCKQCLNTLQNGDNIIPRTEVIEHCAMMLLNLNDWHSLINLDKRLMTNNLELTIAFAATFIEIEKFKIGKKSSRDLWDLILTMFSNTTLKRTGSTAGVSTTSNTSSNVNTACTGGGGSGGGGGGGGSGGSSRNSPAPSNSTVSTNLYPFLQKVRDPMVFSLAMSLLAKIHNILKDDSNLDISGEYMYLWQTNISNSIGYNIRAVGETLMWLLKKALKYYPQNTNWLKIKGDLQLAINDNEGAMRSYVNVLVTASEYCSLPLQKNIVDDYIIRKMIKCAANMQCYMQAAILCQFLDEIDYSLAFKHISEKSSSFHDAMDAYYNCIWDTTLLEFIVNLHSKKGEHTKRLEAISIMSQLELNSNNNEEIRREAAAIRKTRFIRALAKQYLF